jgi:hypothetical protein
MKIRAMQKGNMMHNINNFGNRPILKADYSSLIIKLSRKRPNKMPNTTRTNSLNHTIFICNKDSSHHAIAAAKWQASSLSSCIQWPLVVLATVPGVAIDPLMMLWTMMMHYANQLQALPPRRDDDKDGSHQAQGQVRPGTKRSHSQSHSLSSGDPTKYKQALITPPPDRPAEKTMPSI